MAKAIAEMNTYDAVNHPRHYTQHPSGVECIQVDPAAQWEIREYANAVGRIIDQEFPRTWQLFQETLRRKAAGKSTRCGLTFLN